ncbi:MAG: rhodanese-like domain-containing protein [bacterium]|nr:rhodanese-like domain-containing protein [bacterium]
MGRFSVTALAAGLLGVALIALIATVAGCGHGRADVASVDASALAARIEARDAPVIVDVRSEREYADGHIPGAVNIAHDQLEARLGELPSERDAEIVVYCQSGFRAGAAERALIAAGYSNLLDLDGHWAGWSKASLPRE